MKINLPSGHEWREHESGSSSETLFICKDCGASFIHNMMDGSTHFEIGYGECEDGENPEHEIC